MPTPPTRTLCCAVLPCVATPAGQGHPVQGTARRGGSRPLYPQADGGGALEGQADGLEAVAHNTQTDTVASSGSRPAAAAASFGPHRPCSELCNSRGHEVFRLRTTQNDGPTYSSRPKPRLRGRRINSAQFQRALHSPLALTTVQSRYLHTYTTTHRKEANTMAFLLGCSSTSLRQAVPQCTCIRPSFAHSQPP